MLLLETAKKMMVSGARVSVTSLAEDLFRISLVHRLGSGLEVVGFEYSFFEASKADLVIANTAVCKTWVRIFLDRFPNMEHKLIWWIHELSPNQSYGDSGTFADGLVYLDKVQCALFDSQASREMWEKSGLALPANARVISPCLTDEFMKRASKEKVRFPIATCWNHFSLNIPLNRKQIRQRLGVAEQDFLLSLSGSYSAEKGHDLLACTVNQILEENPGISIKLLLLGFWNYASRKRFLKTFGSSAISPERTFLNVREVHGFFHASDCLVMNSQSYGECFGRVTIEAMAHRLPVLGTDAGGTRDIIESGVTGLFHPLGKEGQQILKKNILTLYENRTLAKEMGEAGFSRVNQLFSEETFLTNFDAAIH